jgi:uncharacterized protein (DUF934 family)
MGWTEDLYRSGQITEDELEYLREKGYDAYHYGDVEAIQVLMEYAEEFGLDDLYDSLRQYWEEGIEFWESENDYRIYYDDEVKRWRDVESGRFVADPYRQIEEV